MFEKLTVNKSNAERQIQYFQGQKLSILQTLLDISEMQNTMYVFSI